MKVTKIFKNDNGDAYEVICTLTTSVTDREPNWNVYVNKKPKGKRKFISLGSSEDRLRYTNIPRNEYTAYRYKEYAQEVPWEWIESTMDDVLAEIKKFVNNNVRVLWKKE